MGLPNVVILVNRNGLGLVSYSDDGITGLVLSGVAVAGKIQLQEPHLIYGLSGAEDIGVTETGNAVAWKQIKEFYDEAGNGTPLYFILSSENIMSSNIGDTAALGILLNYSQGKISLIGLGEGASQTGTIVDELDEDVLVAANAMQIYAENWAAKLMPFSAVIPGIGYGGDEATVADLKTYTKNRVSVLLACSEADKVVSVGQFLGREASNPVQRKPSRVRSGALTNLDGYLADGLSIEDSIERLGALHDKGYIVYRTFAPVKSGYFYSGDPTMCPDTDDLNTIARNRVIDKVTKYAYKTYIEELDEDVDVTDEGYLHPAKVGNLKSEVETAVRAACSGEISNFYADIDAEQNILSGAPFEITLNITPKGYLSNIKVTIGFINPYNV